MARFNITAGIAATLLALASPIYAGPLPAADAAPNGDVLVPGAGLPSLESLGLTQANLQDEAFMLSYFESRNITLRQPDEDTASLAKRQSRSECGQDPFYHGFVVSARACYWYLRSTLPAGTVCAAPPMAPQDGHSWCVMWHNGYPTDVRGRSLTSGDSASLCADAAVGIQWGLDNCVTSGGPPGSEGYVQSWAPAWGNGNLEVNVRRA